MKNSKKNNQGVHGFIRDQLPYEWEWSLRKHKCYLTFVNQLYDNIVNAKHKNKYYYMISIRNIQHTLKNYSFMEIITMFNFKPNISFWQKVYDDVKTYYDLYK